MTDNSLRFQTMRSSGNTLKSTLTSKKIYEQKSDQQTTESLNQYVSTSPIQKYSPINSTYITPTNTTKLRLDTNSTTKQQHSTTPSNSYTVSTLLNKVCTIYHKFYMFSTDIIT